MEAESQGATLWGSDLTLKVGFAAADWCYLTSTSSDPDVVQGLWQSSHNSLLQTDHRGSVDSIKQQQQGVKNCSNVKKPGDVKLY